MQDDLDKQVSKLTREMIQTDPLLVAIGRALAPQVNASLGALKSPPHNRKTAKPTADDYCPGCGDLSSWSPDLCPECLALNAT